MSRKTRFVLDVLFGSNGVITALSAVAIIVSVSIIFDVRISLDFLAVVLLLSLATYFFDFFDDKSDFSLKSEKEIAIKETPLFKLVILALLGTAIFIVHRYSNLRSLLFLLALIPVGILYPIVFKKITKKIVGFKDFYVALAWNLIVIFFLVYYDQKISLGLIYFLVFLFIRDLMNVIYCDIKDRQIDAEIGLLTFPVAIGKQRSLILIFVLNFVSAALLVLGVLLGTLPNIMLAILAPIFVILLLIFAFSRAGKFPAYAVDVENFVWLAALLVYSRLS